MDRAVVEQRIRQGEDAATEFKSASALHAERLAKAIVGLANSGGGLLILGVEDDGAPTGCPNPDAAMQKLAQVFQQNVVPPLWCRVTKVELTAPEGHALGPMLVIAEVPEFSPGRPFRTNDGHFYVRYGSTTRDATRDDLHRVLQSTDWYFDEQPVGGATFEDLDPEAIRRYASTAWPGKNLDPAATRHYLAAIQALTRDGVPTVTGILMFGRAPQQYLPDANISAVRVRGTVLTGDFLDRREIGGRLMDQVEEAAQFLHTHVPQPARVEGMRRIEGGIPEAVWREGLVNAVSHRDYRAASQVRLLVFDDRVEIVNPGSLLNQLSVEGIKLGGISQRRNPRLSAALARAHGGAA